MMTVKVYLKAGGDVSVNNVVSVTIKNSVLYVRAKDRTSKAALVFPLVNVLFYQEEDNA